MRCGLGRGRSPGGVGGCLLVGFEMDGAALFGMGDALEGVVVGGLCIKFGQRWQNHHFDCAVTRHYQTYAPHS